MSASTTLSWGSQKRPLHVVAPLQPQSYAGMSRGNVRHVLHVGPHPHTPHNAHTHAHRSLPLLQVHSPHLIFKCPRPSLASKLRKWAWRTGYKRRTHAERSRCGAKWEVLESEWPPMIEREQAAGERFFSTIQQLALAHPGKHVLFVSHGKAVQVGRLVGQAGGHRLAAVAVAVGATAYPQLVNIDVNIASACCSCLPASPTRAWAPRPAPPAAAHTCRAHAQPPHAGCARVRGAGAARAAGGLCRLHGLPAAARHDRTGLARVPARPRPAHLLGGVCRPPPEAAAVTSGAASACAVAVR